MGQAGALQCIAVTMFRQNWKVYLRKRLSTESSQLETLHEDNLYASWRFMLFLGRFTGLIPFDFALKRRARARNVRYAVMGPMSNIIRVIAELVVAAGRLRALLASQY